MSFTANVNITSFFALPIDQHTHSIDRNVQIEVHSITVCQHCLNRFIQFNIGLLICRKH